MANVVQADVPSADEITEAWVYLLGRYLVVRQEGLDLSEEGVDYNLLKHNPAVRTGDASGSAPTFVNPNLDVVYSEAWLAVDDETLVILELPEIRGRYYTAQIVDEWAEITHNINERNYPDRPYGRYAVCLAGSSAQVPEGCARVDLTSPKAKLLARVEIGADPDEAVRLQHALSLKSTGTPRITARVEFPPFTNAALPGATVFAQPQLDGALAPADACGKAAQMHPLIRRIAAYVQADKANFESVDQIVHATAIPKFMHFVMSFGNVTNGWSSTAKYPAFGDDYWFRATANFAGIWWNSSKEAVYELLHVDADGAPVSGDATYAMRFDARRTPDTVVDGFWSLTVYGKPDYMLVPNQLSRYTLGYRSDLASADDGSVTLYFGAQRPEGVPESNWLPTPPGKEFTANLRLYLPHAAVRGGTWTPPPLVKQ